LQQLSKPGSQRLLMYDAGLEYLAALTGCLYAGVVAVPAYPPDPMRAARTLPRLEGIVRDAQATLLLGTSSDLAWAGAMLGDLPCLESLVATDAIELSLAERWTAPRIDRETLAFLQYTSGSTGEPKGVMIRHGNVLHNLAQMEETVDIDNAVACLWLPAYHDMGLIGTILQCWYSGRHNVMLSPSPFQRPLRWLEAIARHRVTTTGAPDFGYDLCVRKIKPEERRELDLSCWRLAFGGRAGPSPNDRPLLRGLRALWSASRSSVRRFGLAEATLMVACSPKLSLPVVRSFDGSSRTKRSHCRAASAIETKSGAGCDPMLRPPTVPPMVFLRARSSPAAVAFAPADRHRRPQTRQELRRTRRRNL
jgi:acyl-CoA synthetase (AMP-forming)/AMP-acid ligase II